MKLLTFLLSALCIAQIASASGWRADGKGSFPDSKITTSWAPEKNVVWKKALPQWSNASPVIDGDRLFVCADPATILCLSKKDGSVIWKAEHTFESFLSPEDQAKAKTLAPKVTALRAQAKKLGKQLWSLKKKVKDDKELKKQQAPLQAELDKLNLELAEADQFTSPSTHDTTGYSTPTPACDGKNILTVFGSGVAACHSIDGKKKWARRIGRPTHKWGHSGSPVIVDNKAILQITDVLALDIETGKELWKVPGKQVFGSLVHARINDKDLIVTAEGKVIDADDGTVLADGLHKLAYAAPIVVGDIAYFIENGGQAFKLSVGETVKAEELWKTEPKNDRYYASPVYHEGLIYAVTRRGDFSVINTEDGEVVHAEKLAPKGTYYPSIVYAGGYIIVSSDSGEAVIMKPGRKPEKISSNTLEGYRSTPIFDGSRMYVRGMKNLYCVGE